MNKHFNSYKEGLDLEFLREYCMEHGERRTFLRGETLEEAGEPAQWVVFVERGCFKYMVHNDEEGKEYCTGFAFEGEFVADFPYCLDGDAAPTSLVAVVPSAVYVVDGADLERHYRQSQVAERMGRDYMAYCLGQVKSHINNFYFKNNQRI
ncbi:MAG: Crp/Fnr family transcriptional regulator [Bacteroidaceae bacterium]|nr:Crp/Fnr family transcriptional regulator [Bacteroidaceae bacterium]